MSQNSAYQRQQFVTPAYAQANAYQSAQAVKYGASGDHLFVQQINGPGNLQVRFGTHSPWIDVTEGMELVRDFTEVWMRDTTVYAGKVRQLTEAVFYTSYGCLFSRTGRSHAIKGGFRASSFALAANANTVLEAMASTGATANGKLGSGTIIIKVASTATHGVAVWQGRTSDAYAANRAEAYWIEPGQFLSFDYDGKLSLTYGVGATDSPVSFALMIAPLAAGETPTVSVMYNVSDDLTDIPYTSFAGVTPLDNQG